MCEKDGDCKCEDSEKKTSIPRESYILKLIYVI